MPVIDINPDFFNQDAQAGGFFPETHTNPGFDIVKFIPPNGKNYLIEGIRGTGKTHILKMIYEQCINSYEEKKILPIYLSLAKVSEWVQKDMALFRLHLYSNIVCESIKSIKKNKHNLDLAGNGDIQKHIKRIAQMFGLNEDEDFEKIILKIENLQEDLLNKLTYNIEQVLEKTIKEESNDTSFKIGDNKAQLTLQEFLKILEHKEIQYVGKALSHENASAFIIEYFNQLKEILKYNYAIILLDECSEFSKESQVEVFRLFKLIRGAFTDTTTKNNAYFCAAVYPFPQTYYPTKQKGDLFNFDIGDDAIMEYLQLDELSDEYTQFFQEVTKKRIALIFKKEEANTNYLDIFENERAFILAAYCSNGIIRRYFEILKYSYDSLCHRIGGNAIGQTKKISIKDVEEAIDTIVPNKLLSQDRLGKRDFQIIDDISGRIQKRNKKNETENKLKEEKDKLPSNVYFTISRTELYDLGDLLVQGVLHDKNKSRLKKYHKNEGTRGPLIMLDLSVAFHNGAIERPKAVEIFNSELKINAKSGYSWCQDFTLPANLQNKEIREFTK